MVDLLFGTIQVLCTLIKISCTKHFLRKIPGKEKNVPAYILKSQKHLYHFKGGGLAHDW